MSSASLQYTRSLYKINLYFSQMLARDNIKMQLRKNPFTMAVERMKYIERNLTKEAQTHTLKTTKHVERYLRT